jgi:hypothetical protein
MADKAATERGSVLVFKTNGHLQYLGVFCNVCSSCYFASTYTCTVVSMTSGLLPRNPETWEGTYFRVLTIGRTRIGFIAWSRATSRA